MRYKEYFSEGGNKVDLAKLKKGFIPEQEYIPIHRDSALLCADALIWYKTGWLLVKRKNFPLNEEYCTVGGRISKGIPTEISLKKKAKEECNLEISNLKFVGVGRTFFNTDPFGHGKGTDTTAMMYLADGKGELKIDSFHSDYILVNEKNFKNFKETLHPYIRDFLEIGMSLAK